jgi:hypothetical protein
MIIGGEKKTPWLWSASELVEEKTSKNYWQWKLVFGGK